MNKKNLTQFGFNSAAQSLGDLQVFKRNLEDIFSQKLVDESIKVEDVENRKRKIENQKIGKRSQVEDLEAEILYLNNKVNDVDIEIKEWEAKIKDFETNPNSTLRPPGGIFSWSKFLPLLVFLIGLSIFLFIYYVSIPYRSLYDPFSGCNPPSIWPNWDEFKYALADKPAIGFIPFVFFCFGYALHIISDFKKTLYRVLSFIFVILVTLALDILLAAFLHDKFDTQALRCFQIPKSPWWSSGMVYILFMMGFVVFFIWSLLFHTAMIEWQKRNPIKVMFDYLDKQKEEQKNLKDLLNKNKQEVLKLVKSVENLDDRLSGGLLLDHELQQSMSKFSKGWFQFLAAGNSAEEIKNETNTIYEEYLKRLEYDM